VNTTPNAMGKDRSGDECSVPVQARIVPGLVFNFRMLIEAAVTRIARVAGVTRDSLWLIFVGLFVGFPVLPRKRIVAQLRQKSGDNSSNLEAATVL
jgi:hypothetical protein